MLELQQFRCGLCGRDLTKLAPKRIHAHHIDWSGDTDRENNTLSNIIVLCDLCHNRAHTRLKIGGIWRMSGTIMEKEMYIELLSKINRQIRGGVWNPNPETKEIPKV